MKKNLLILFWICLLSSFLISNSLAFSIMGYSSIKGKSGPCTFTDFCPIYGPGTLDTGSGHQQWVYRGQSGVALGIDILPFLKEGENEIIIELAYTEGGKAWFDFSTASCSKEWVDVGGKCADYNSKIDSHQCTVTQPEFCSEGEETRFISGHNFHNKCWNYQTDYTCYLGQTQDDDDCKEYQNGQCSLLGSECLEAWPEGTCKDKELSYSCSNGDGEEVEELVCNTGFGNDIFDVNTDYEGNKDFAKAISTLAMVDALTKDLTIDDISVFSGEAYHCTTSSVYSINANCCPRASINPATGAIDKDHVSYGWEAYCKPNDKDYRVGPHMAKGHCIDFGRYCTEKALGVCMKYRRGHCCFDSTLARILQEQGKKQLGISFGDRKNPDCRSFTTDELERIDWNRLDLSDFYNEVLENFTPPDEDELTEQLENRLQDLIQFGPSEPAERQFAPKNKE